MSRLKVFFKGVTISRKSGGLFDKALWFVVRKEIQELVMFTQKKIVAYELEKNRYC